MESLTSLFQCHLELQSGALLDVSSMELPLPAPGLPQAQPLGCWCFWNWDNDLALSSWCLHELLHDLTSPTVPKLLFPSSGEMPTQELCPEAKLTLCNSVSLKTRSSSERELVLAESSPWREETPKSGAFLHSEGFAFPGDSCDEFGCAAPSAARSHGFHPQLRIQLLPSAPQRSCWALPASSQRIWVNVVIHILCWFIPEVYSTSAAVHSPSPVRTRALCIQGVSSPKYFRVGHVSCATPGWTSWGLSQGQWWGNAALDLGGSTGAGSVQGEGRWEHPQDLRLLEGKFGANQLRAAQSGYNRHPDFSPVVVFLSV